MFYSLFGKLQERGFDHFMILESPALPIRKHWLDAIAKAATQEKCALNRSDSLGSLRARAVMYLALRSQAFGSTITLRADRCNDFWVRGSAPRCRGDFEDHERRGDKHINMNAIYCIADP